MRFFLSLPQVLHRRRAAMFAAVSAVVLLGYSETRVFAQITPAPFEYGSAMLETATSEFRRDLQQETQRHLFSALHRFPNAPASDHATLLLAESQFRAGRQNPDEYTHGWRTLDSFALTRPQSPLLPFAYELSAKRSIEQRRFATARKAFQNAAWLAEARAALSNDSTEKADFMRLVGDSYFWRAIAFGEEIRYDSAQYYFVRLSARFPKHALADDALFLNARFDELSRNYEQALSAYERIIKNYPFANTRVAAHLRSAQCHLQFRRATRAISELEQASSILADLGNTTPSRTSRYETQDFVPDADVQLLYLRGEAYLAAKQYDAALKAFNAIIQLPSNTAPMLALRSRLGKGFALLNTPVVAGNSIGSRIDSAIAEYDTVLTADAQQGLSAANPEYTRLASMARLYRTIALKRKGEREAARKELSALAVQSDFPYSAQALLELGELYYADGKPDEARKTLERAAREAPDLATQARVNLLLGENALEYRQYALAIRAFERTEQNIKQTSAFQLGNREDILAEAVLKRGVALVGAKEYREAMAVLTRFLNDNPDRTEAPEAAFWLVEAEFHADLLQNAAQNYQAFLAKYASHERSEEAMYGLGWSQFRLRQFGESAMTFTRLLREFPESRFALDVLVRKGDGLYLSKNYRAAAEAYRQALKMPTNTDVAANNDEEGSPKSRKNAPDKTNAEQREYAAFQLGQSLYRLQEFEAAIAAMKDFATRYAASPLADDALYGAAWMLFQERKYDQAAQEFTKLVEAYPLASASPRAYYALGDSYFNLMNYDAAIKSYRAVADIFPLSEYAADAVSAMQYAYMMQGKDDSASLAADRYINANPGSSLSQEVKFKKAEMLFNAGKFMNAASEYEDFIAKNRQNPRSAEALFQLGRSYAAINDTSKALSAFRRVREDYAQGNFAAPALLETALIRLSQQKFTEADTLFATLERTYPTDDAAVRAAFERANMQESRGDTTEALRQYRTIADKYAGTDYGDRCRFRVGMYFRQNNFTDSARAQFLVLASSRNDELGAEAQYRTGELFQRDKRFREAIEAFLKTTTAFAGQEDWHTLALLNAGACYEALKQNDLAKETYRLVLMRRPDDDFGKTAQQRLEKLEKM
ncbi:MAG: outer membrane protein assembly factor BamD [Candidatus Kapaibacterium sp.]|nr:MAG: outer membrane protein assembly factor BamD [Candidatus Kapabacteria bacterium]